jgi:hypothetical protein
VYPRYDALDHEQRSQVDLALTHGGSRRTIDTLPGSVLGYEEIVQKNKGWKGDVPSGKLGEKNAEKLMRELRWANLGWVYQVSGCGSSVRTTRSAAPAEAALRTETTKERSMSGLS